MSLSSTPFKYYPGQKHCNCKKYFPNGSLCHERTSDGVMCRCGVRKDRMGAEAKLFSRH